MVRLQASSGDEVSKEFHLFPKEFTLGQLQLQSSLLNGIQNKRQVVQMFLQGL